MAWAYAGCALAYDTPISVDVAASPIVSGTLTAIESDTQLAQDNLLKLFGQSASDLTGNRRA